MAKITYENKVALNVNSDIADVNKVNASDLNEIKNVVNTNDNNAGLLSNLNTTNKDNLVGAINEVLSNDTTKGTYSTNEIVIGKWIDNKPIYRKVINTTKSQVSDIMTNLHIKRLISTVGSYATSIYSNCWPIPSYYTEETQYNIGLMGGTIPGENVSITFGSNYNDSSAVLLILEYTKTTD